ncbi:MAG: hypothetical protein HFG27_08620 [Provencibacterium sp.]|jgi:hypothetical protein|nr:hypothetical protein [Provencibacterium sp.]
MAVEFTQKASINGEWEEMYPKTSAAQVETDTERQFVSAAEKEALAAAASSPKVTVGQTAPDAPKEGDIWLDTSSAALPEPPEVEPEESPEEPDNE